MLLFQKVGKEADRGSVFSSCFFDSAGAGISTQGQLSLFPLACIAALFSTSETPFPRVARLLDYPRQAGMRNNEPQDVERKKKKKKKKRGQWKHRKRRESDRESSAHTIGLGYRSLSSHRLPLAWPLRSSFSCRWKISKADQEKEEKQRQRQTWRENKACAQNKPKKKQLFPNLSEARHVSFTGADCICVCVCARTHTHTHTSPSLISRCLALDLSPSPMQLTKKKKGENTHIQAA